MKISTVTGWLLAVSSLVFVLLLTGLGSDAFTNDPPAVDPYASGATTSTAAPADNADPASLVAAADVYARRCAACHGGDRQGGSGPSLQPGSPAAAKPADALRSTIADGAGGMPAWGNRLTPGEIDALVTLIKTG